MAYYITRHSRDAHDYFAPPVCTGCVRPQSVDRVGRTNPGYIEPVYVKPVRQPGMAATAGAAGGAGASSSGSSVTTVAVVVAVTAGVIILTAAVALAVTFGVLWQQEKTDKTADATTPATAEGSSSAPVVTCTELTPHLTCNAYIGGSVYLMTILGDEVFVTKNSDNPILVYDALTLEFKRNISVPGLDKYAGGLVASAQDNCLYVSNWLSRKVFKVKLPNGPVMEQWSVDSSPYAVAINRAQNVIVNVPNVNKIKEYTPAGILVREVTVPSTFFINHVKQLPNGQFLVSNSVTMPEAKLAVLDANNGSVVRGYAGLLSPGRGFDVFKNGYVLAADSYNSRLHAVNPTLTDGRVLHGLQLTKPVAVQIDESRGRAYIGESSDGGRLLVLEHVFGQCLAF